MINNRSRSIAVLPGVGAGATFKKIGAGAEPDFAFFYRFSSFVSSDAFCQSTEIALLTGVETGVGV